MDDVRAPIKPCRDDLRSLGEIVVDVRTAQGDQVRAMCKFRQRGAQPALGEYRVGIDISYQLAFGRKTSGLASLNQSPLRLIDDFDIGP